MLLPFTTSFPSTPTHKLPITGISLFDDNIPSSSSTWETPDIISHQPSLLYFYAVSSYCNDIAVVAEEIGWQRHYIYAVSFILLALAPHRALRPPRGAAYSRET